MAPGVLRWYWEDSAGQCNESFFNESQYLPHGLDEIVAEVLELNVVLFDRGVTPTKSY